MKNTAAVLIALILGAVSLTACGIRVEPKDPPGKIKPSSQY